MVGADEVRTALRTSWQRSAEECTALSAGPDPTAWLVDLGDRRCVAKVVPLSRRRGFEAGLAAAERLAAAGLAAGSPLRTGDGALSLVLGDFVIAVLCHVPGRPLDRDNPLDQQWWGDALGAAHRALAGFDHSGLTRFHWVRPDAPHLAVEDWIRPAVTAAVDAIAKLSITDQLSYGVLHGDPGPEAFRLDVETGRTGLVDWGATASGPLVYDVASAVMHAGGPDRAAELLDGYLATAPVPPDEVEAALPTLLRFRYAVQADRYAKRLWADRNTGRARSTETRIALDRVRSLLTGGV